MRLMEETKEISKEEYELYVDASVEDRNDFVESIAIKCMWHPSGYGCFGIRLYAENNRYCASWQHYDSCD